MVKHHKRRDCPKVPFSFISFHHPCFCVSRRDNYKWHINACSYGDIIIWSSSTTSCMWLHHNLIKKSHDHWSHRNISKAEGDRALWFNAKWWGCTADYKAADTKVFNSYWQITSLVNVACQIKLRRTGIIGHSFPETVWFATKKM